MRLYTVFRIHKLTGLALGFILLLLGFTGFFLNHDNFNILWDVRINDSILPQSIIDNKRKAFNAYKINERNPQHIVTGSRMGLFVSFDAGQHFEKTLAQQVLAIQPEKTPESAYQENFKILYAATTNGLFRSDDSGLSWKHFALESKVVDSFNLFNGYIYAVVNKRDIYRINIESHNAEKLDFHPIAAEVLPKKVTLSRLVRDLHYGRGLFSGDSSLFINDFSSFVLVFLGVSGFVIYFLTRRIRAKHDINKKNFRRWVKLHSNIIILFTFVPILMLLVTGVFLDHSKLFQNVMKKTVFDTLYLPPVYKNLRTDIWGVDFDGDNYRIGNRLGVFKSTDLKNWTLESTGFSYRLIRVNDDLFISGMGSPNRQLTEEGWKPLKGTPHMPRDIYQINNKPVFYSTRAKETKLPSLDKTPLYYLMLGLHDGKLFSGNWVFVNDLAALVGVILLITGFIKWRKRKQRRKNIFINLKSITPRMKRDC